MTPACVICGDETSRGRRKHHLTHGVAIWLCGTHADEAYLHRQGGLLFAERLAGIWLAAGAITARRRAALRTFVARIAHGGRDRDRPGSYSWPRLREEAERRFARGDDPNAVIAELRSRHDGDTAVAPSIRTMRRWFTDARWFRRPPPPHLRVRLPTRFAWLVPTRPDPAMYRWPDPPRDAPDPWDDT